MGTVNAKATVLVLVICRIVRFGNGGDGARADGQAAFT